MKIAHMHHGVYEGDDVPVAVVLTPRDKELIANMAPDATIYCVFPDTIDPGRIERWLEWLKAEQSTKEG